MSEAASSVERREQMVERQIVTRGVRDAAVLAAMRSVPREMFVPPHLRSQAYEDEPLSIGEGQTISQPYVIAALAASARRSLAEPRCGRLHCALGQGPGIRLTDHGR